MIWVKELIDKLVNFYVRPRNIGVRIIRTSFSLLAVLAASGGISVVIRSLDSSSELSLSWGDGPGAIAFWVLLVVALIGVAFGFWLAKRHDDYDLNVKQVSRVFVVELRGLVDTTDSPLINAVPVELVGRRESCLVDIRRLVAGKVPNIQEALSELLQLQRQLRLVRTGTSREHVTVVVGGVMQVSLLFYAGVLLDDEGKVLLFEWERAGKKWMELSQPDDGGRFDIVGLDELAVHSSDVVVAVSATYFVDLVGIAQTFPSMPIVHLQLSDPKPNRLWSEATQVELARQFTDLMAELANRSVRTVHLILAASPTLCIRFGQAYDHRNMPYVNCYQRERDQVPPYPWSVRLEGNEPGKFEKTSSSVVCQ
ncbi:SAVED domain-containing protein [Alcaligenes sp. CHO6]|uniref:SAVED domain-containing protein n=1 Tax=Alcaligenes sp. CHO6 TaxID=3123298 RepID=UPI00301515BD